jgi:hypothetical protein
MNHSQQRNTKRKKCKYQHTTEYLIKKYMNNAYEDMANRMDNAIFGWNKNALMYGRGEMRVKWDRWYYLKEKIKNFIKKIRIGLAEFIGGDDLHENCYE